MHAALEIGEHRPTLWQCRSCTLFPRSSLVVKKQLFDCYEWLRVGRSRTLLEAIKVIIKRVGGATDITCT